jgi:hypothetical protein
MLQVNADESSYSRADGLSGEHRLAGQVSCEVRKVLADPPGRSQPPWLEDC